MSKTIQNELQEGEGKAVEKRNSENDIIEIFDDEDDNDVCLVENKPIVEVKKEKHDTNKNKNEVALTPDKRKRLAVLMQSGMSREVALKAILSFDNEKSNSTSKKTTIVQVQSKNKQTKKLDQQGSKKNFKPDTGVSEVRLSRGMRRKIRQQQNQGLIENQQKHVEVRNQPKLPENFKNKIWEIKTDRRTENVVSVKKAVEGEYKSIAEKVADRLNKKTEERKRPYLPSNVASEKKSNFLKNKPKDEAVASRNNFKKPENANRPDSSYFGKPNLPKTVTTFKNRKPGSLDRALPIESKEKHSGKRYRNDENRRASRVEEESQRVPRDAQHNRNTHSDINPYERNTRPEEEVKGARSRRSPGPSDHFGNKYERRSGSKEWQRAKRPRISGERDQMNFSDRDPELGPSGLSYFGNERGTRSDSKDRRWLDKPRHSKEQEYFTDIESEHHQREDPYLGSEHQPISSNRESWRFEGPRLSKEREEEHFTHIGSEHRQREDPYLGSEDQPILSNKESWRFEKPRFSKEHEEEHFTEVGSEHHGHSYLGMKHQSRSSNKGSLRFEEPRLSKEREEEYFTEFDSEHRHPYFENEHQSISSNKESLRFEAPRLSKERKEEYFAEIGSDHREREDPYFGIEQQPISSDKESLRFEGPRLSKERREKYSNDNPEDYQRGRSYFGSESGARSDSEDRRRFDRPRLSKDQEYFPDNVPEHRQRDHPYLESEHELISSNKDSWRFEKPRRSEERQQEYFQDIRAEHRQRPYLESEHHPISSTKDSWGFEKPRLSEERQQEHFPDIRTKHRQSDHPYLESEHELFPNNKDRWSFEPPRLSEERNQDFEPERSPRFERGRDILSDSGDRWRHDRSRFSKDRDCFTDIGSKRRQGGDQYLEDENLRSDRPRDIVSRSSKEREQDYFTGRGSDYRQSGNRFLEKGHESFSDREKWAQALSGVPKEVEEENFTDTGSRYPQSNRQYHEDEGRLGSDSNRLIYSNEPEKDSIYVTFDNRSNDYRLNKDKRSSSVEKLRFDEPESFEKRQEHRISGYNESKELLHLDKRNKCRYQDVVDDERVASSQLEWHKDGSQRSTREENQGFNYQRDERSRSGDRIKLRDFDGLRGKSEQFTRGNRRFNESSDDVKKWEYAINELQKSLGDVKDRKSHLPHTSVSSSQVDDSRQKRGYHNEGGYERGGDRHSEPHEPNYAKNDRGGDSSRERMRKRFDVDVDPYGNKLPSYNDDLRVGNEERQREYDYPDVPEDFEEDNEGVDFDFNFGRKNAVAQIAGPSTSKFSAPLSKGRGRNKLIAVLPTEYPEVRLTVAECASLQQMVLRAIEAIPPNGPQVQFSRGRANRQGYLQLYCVGEETVKWIKEITPSIKIRDRTFYAVENAHVPRKQKLCVNIPNYWGERLTPESVTTRLKKSNKNLMVEEWKTLNVEEKDGGQLFLFLVDAKSFNYLRQESMMAFFGFTKVTFFFPPGKKKLKALRRAEIKKAMNVKR